MLSFLLAILIFSTLLGIPAFARSEHDDPDVLRRLNDLLKEKDRLGKDYKDVVRETSLEYKKLLDSNIQQFEQDQKILAAQRDRLANGQELLTQQEQNVARAEDNYQKHLDIVKARERELELAAEKFGVTSKEFEQDTRRYAFAEKEANLAAERLGTENKITEAQEAAQGVVTDLAGRYLGLAKSFKETGAGKAFDAIQTLGLTGALSEMAKQAAETFSPMNVMAGITSKVAESTKAMVIATDSAISSFRRNTGAGSEMNEVLFQARIDSANVGATMGQTAEAAGALFNQMRQFSELGEETRTELVAFATTMENLGVSSAATAEFMNNASAAMGMNADQSMAAQRELAAAGVALGMAPGEMMEGFNQAFPQLAAHGESAVDVFKGIAAAAKATGASMNTLLGVFGQAMDTFEGTAEVAGRVNAVLGNDLLNSVDLLNASEDERIRMMIEAIELSGRSFDAMGRFERRALANAAGITDMAEANRIFGTSLSAFDEQQRQARESGMSQEQLEERAAAATSAMEKLQAIFESMAIAVGPLINALHSLMNGVLAIQKATGEMFVPVVLVLGVGLATLFSIFTKLIPVINFFGIGAAAAAPASSALATGITAVGAAGGAAAPGLTALGISLLAVGGAIALVVSSIALMAFGLGSMFDSIAGLGGAGNLAAVLGATADGIFKIGLAMLSVPILKSVAFRATIDKMTDFAAVASPTTAEAASGLVDSIKEIAEIKITGAMSAALMLGTLTNLVQALNNGAAAGGGGGGGQQRAVVLELDGRQFGRAVVDLIEDRYTLRPS